jgi:hypothetical protein
MRGAGRPDRRLGLVATSVLDGIVIPEASPDRRTDRPHRIARTLTGRPRQIGTSACPRTGGMGAGGLVLRGRSARELGTLLRRTRGTVKLTPAVRLVAPRLA